ncbi:hypothetical protein NC651_026382 [Populus alba x Populus x berolinensis]|nr:hypothetical protein NC651_026382 [Populus alba x Populus x berolinensis]
MRNRNTWMAQETLPVNLLCGKKWKHIPWLEMLYAFHLEITKMDASLTCKFMNPTASS